MRVGESFGFECVSYGVRSSDGNIGIVIADITRIIPLHIVDIIVVVCVAIEGIRNIRQPIQTFAQIFISF